MSSVAAAADICSAIVTDRQSRPDPRPQNRVEESAREREREKRWMESAVLKKCTIREDALVHKDTEYNAQRDTL